MGRLVAGRMGSRLYRTEGGEVFNVLFDDGSKVGLAPGPRYLFFDTEYHVEGDELKVDEHEGIFIDATEVVAVRVEHVQ